MSARIYSLEPVYCESMPSTLQEGKLYISHKYGIAVHLCACGCGQQTVTGFEPHWPGSWVLTEKDGRITLRPSIGNFLGEDPYHAHYFITDNKIEWV